MLKADLYTNYLVNNMDIQEHTTPERLLRYAFLWSIARMMIGAVSLFFGVMPVLYRLMSSAANTPLTLAYLITLAASGYLVYLWFSKHDKRVFGDDDMKDKVAFLIMSVTGLNLGLSAIINDNIGIGLMQTVFSYDLGELLFKAVAVIYLAVAYYLWKRWKENGEELFGSGASAAPAPEQNQ